MKKIFMVLLTAIFVCSGCSRSVDMSTREDKDPASYTTVKIGVAAPTDIIFPACYYDEGLQLAVKEINASGGVLGKKLELVIKDDQSNVETGMKVAETLAGDPEVVAVIGHWYSDISIAAATTYQDAGILMLTPVASSDALTALGHDLVFRLGMSNSMMAAYASELAYRDGVKNITVYHADNEYGRDLSRSFESNAGELGINIVDRNSNFKNRHEMELFVNKWSLLDNQGIFVADFYPHAAEIIQDLWDSGFEGNIYGADGLDSEEMIGVLGSKADGLTIPTAFDPQGDSRELQDFTASFRQEYSGKEPDVYAALGYECVRLIAAAIEKSDSLRPTEMGTALHGFKDYPTVFGQITFGQDGQATGMDIYTKRVLHGRFVIDKGVLSNDEQ